MGEFSYVSTGILSSMTIAMLVGGAIAIDSRKHTQPANWGMGLALGIAYALGHAFIREWLQAGRLRDARMTLGEWSGSIRDFPLFPGDVFDWLPWLVVIATILGTADEVWPAPAWAVSENRLLSVGLLLWLMLNPLTSQAWEPGESARWFLVLGSVILGLWVILVNRAHTLGTAMSTVMILLAGGLAICLGASGSMILALLAAVLCAGCGGLWLACSVDPRLNLARSVVPVFVVAYAGLITCGLCYSELSRTVAILLATAPMATYVDRLTPISRRKTWQVAMVRIGVLLIPLAIAAGWSIALRPPETPDDDYGRATDPPVRWRAELVQSR